MADQTVKLRRLLHQQVTGMRPNRKCPSELVAYVDIAQDRHFFIGQFGWQMSMTPSPLRRKLNEM
jgi:hypothetical protein